MKIAVCAKVVPDSSVARLDPATLRLDRADELRVNPPDLHAVAAAVRLRDEAGAGEVVLLTLGPAASADALRHPLALGADRALLVTGGGAAGSDLLATTRVLALALGREQPDLVLFGQQAADSNGAVLWAAVADRLRLPLASRVVSVTVAPQGVAVSCSSERGLELCELPLPCVLSVSTAISEPPVPTFRELKRAGARPLERISAAELGLEPDELGEAGSGTRVLSLGAPPTRGERRDVVDDGQAAAAIFDLLVARSLI